MYQWQFCMTEGNCESDNGWILLGTTTDPTYTIEDRALEDMPDNRFRVMVADYKDAQGNDEMPVVSAPPTDDNMGIRVRAKVFLEGPLQ